MSVDVRRAADRASTVESWLHSRHSFSFGPHYDPANTHFGLLLAHNEEAVAARHGFGDHPHRDLEIVTWVLEGEVVHRDSRGRGGVIVPGAAQRMSAGSGVVHSERADAHHTRFVQMWVLPDEPGGEPSYEQRDVTADLAAGELVTVASGMPAYADRAAVRLGHREAALHAARPAAGGSLTLPEAPYLHLFVARGSLELEGVGRLDAGDAARLTDTGGRLIDAPDGTDGTDGTELLVWEMHAGWRP